MRKWRCVKTENYAFTVGKTYKSDDRGFNIVANNGYCYDRLSACESLKSSNGFEVTKFEEVKEEQIDREDMIDKLDTDYCFCRDCCDCSFNGHCNFEDMSDEDLTSVYNLAFGVKEDKVEEIKEEKKVNKFKVGDVVEIKDGNDIENYTDGWSYKMRGNIGKKAKISSIEERDGMPCYILCDFNYEKYTQSCVYDERGLELVEYPKTKTITITTSDSTTTLTDGTHTTSINRYYADKHDERVAVNEVVKKYFDEVEMEEKKSKLPKVGDKVRVIGADGTYTRYDDWLIENNIEYKYALLWQENYSPNNNSTGFIRAIYPHLKNKDRILALVETESHAYIINIEGLEVIK